MQTKPCPQPAVKNYRLFDGDAWSQTPIESPAPKVQPTRKAPPLRCYVPSGCYAYTQAGNICGRTPAPFLDLQRGGMVCAEHHQESEGL
jgi:hypothetical protein